ncbi:MAG TPA: Mut7-C RNAse domain-containing protein [Geopsychrobacteraceae bacterium]|nr:Mut7-C RNAse domain-containing protein [Geopsychrobacteraceae bacterium]
MTIETSEEKLAEHLGWFIERPHQEDLNISWAGNPERCRVSWERMLKSDTGKWVPTRNRRHFGEGFMAGQADFHFFGRLATLLTGTNGDAEITYRFNGSPTVKDSVEALGIPHTEIDLILVAGRSVDFNYRIQAADQVEVFPFGATPELLEVVHLSPPLPDEPIFILDVHLGKLARRLRLLGFDCRYRNDYTDSQIIGLALAEGLVILTRDRGILKCARIEQGYLVGSDQVVEQILEVLERFQLRKKIRPLYRCPRCNGLLQSVAKEAVIERLQPKTARYYQTFQLCRSCGQLYWKGSHYQKIKRWIRELTKAEL